MTRPVAIVTGGRQGIGLGIAEALAGAGFDLMLADLTLEGIEPALGRLRSLGAQVEALASDIAELTRHGSVVEATAAAFGRIDVLVNNAGIASPVRGDPLALQPADFDRVIAVNLRGTLFLSQAVARWWLARPEPAARRSIVTVTSVSAEMASPERLDYCVSKAALAMATKCLALRLAPEGIAVFEVRPGIIRTPMTAGVADRYDALIEGGLVPARRWGEPTDVGAAVAALAGGRLGFATGSVLHADGGLAISRL